MHSINSRKILKAMFCSDMQLNKNEDYGTVNHIKTVDGIEASCRTESDYRAYALQTCLIPLNYTL